MSGRGGSSPAVIILAFLTLTGPDNQAIGVNPEAIVSLREPRIAEHFAAGIKCILHMSDGKFITVIETCDEVQRKMEVEQ